jgi:hypothetical protein
LSDVQGTPSFTPSDDVSVINLRALRVEAFIPPPPDSDRKKCHLRLDASSQFSLGYNMPGVQRTHTQTHVYHPPNDVSPDGPPISTHSYVLTSVPMSKGEGLKCPERRHWPTRVTGHAFLACRSSRRCFVYINSDRSAPGRAAWTVHHVQNHALCWITLLQPARRAAVLGQPSSLIGKTHRRDLS